MVRSGRPFGLVSDGPGSSFHSSLMTWNRKLDP
jgi:hypothetical protein